MDTEREREREKSKEVGKKRPRGVRKKETGLQLGELQREGSHLFAASKVLLSRRR